VDVKIPLQVALCNPLNIRRTADVWLGMDATYAGPYCKFIQPEYCYRAGAIILRGYEHRGIHWLGYLPQPSGPPKRGAIPTWAPPEDGNPTDEYIRNVCTWCGYGAEELVALPTLPILRAMTRQESGSVLYADSVILAGIELSQPDHEAS
jgi:hypothetical protein